MVVLCSTCTSAGTRGITLVDGGLLRPRTVCCGLPQHSPLSQRVPPGAALAYRKRIAPIFFTCFHSAPTGVPAHRLRVHAEGAACCSPARLIKCCCIGALRTPCTAPTVRARDTPRVHALLLLTHASKSALTSFSIALGLKCGQRPECWQHFEAGLG